LSHCACIGLPVTHLTQLVAELAPRWQQGRIDRLDARRRRARRRAEGAGRKPKLVFVDQLVITLAYLRLGVPQRVMAALYTVSQATISRAITAVLPLLARRGFATPTGTRLHTLADVIAYSHYTGYPLCIDATDIGVRRPAAGKPGRAAFVSGAKRRNTIKATAISDQADRLLWIGALRPGRMHDQTALKTEGIDTLLEHHPGAAGYTDDGYRGLSREHPGQIHTKPPRAPDTADPDLQAWIRHTRHEHSRARIGIEHVFARMKTWKVLRYWPGPRHHLNQMITAIGGLVSDHTATT
jgi:DDE superfamily endonuclease